jgi:membrane protein DedA with SNARE-associated domain
MLSNVLQIAGVVALAAGAFLFSPALGFLVSGGLLVLIGISLEGK